MASGHPGRDEITYRMGLFSRQGLRVVIELPASSDKALENMRVNISGETTRWCRAVARSKLGHEPIPNADVELIGPAQPVLRFESLIIRLYNRTIEQAVLEICRLAIYYFVNNFADGPALEGLIKNVLRFSWLGDTTDAPFDAYQGDDGFPLRIPESEASRLEKIEGKSRYLMTRNGFPQYISWLKRALVLERGIPGIIALWMEGTTVEESKFMNVGIWKLGLS
jgi:hypothetical protein